MEGSAMTEKEVLEGFFDEEPDLPDTKETDDPETDNIIARYFGDV